MTNANTGPWKIPLDELSDKALITPPYRDALHALKATIRLWELVLNIRWIEFEKACWISDLKQNVLDSLNIDSQQIHSVCPLCEYTAAIRTGNILEKGECRDCSKCPLPEMCCDGDSLCIKVFNAMKAKNYRNLVESMLKFIEMMKDTYAKMVEEAKPKPAPEPTPDPVPTKPNPYILAKHAKDLKALEDSIHLWLHIYSMPDSAYEGVARGLWETDHRLDKGKFIETLKKAAISKLKIDKEMWHFCPLCERHQMTSNCPLADTKTTIDYCWGDCVDATTYGKLERGPEYRILSINDTEIESVSYYFDPYRFLIGQFLSELWHKYLELKPFG